MVPATLNVSKDFGIISVTKNVGLVVVNINVTERLAIVSVIVGTHTSDICVMNNVVKIV